MNFNFDLVISACFKIPLCQCLTLNRPLCAEWLHSSPHRCQEEPDGYCHHSAGVQRQAGRRVQERLHPTAPGLTGGTHRHGVPAAGAQC